MNSQATDALPAGGTAVANTQVVTTITGAAGLRTRLGALALGYSAVAPATPIQATVTDGVSTMYFTVTSNGVVFEPANPVMFATGANVVITLPAGGAGAIGSIAATYYQDKP